LYSCFISSLCGWSLKKRIHRSVQRRWAYTPSSWFEIIEGKQVGLSRRVALAWTLKLCSSVARIQCLTTNCIAIVVSANKIIKTSFKPLFIGKDSNIKLFACRFEYNGKFYFGNGRIEKARTLFKSAGPLEGSQKELT